ncbi:MAG: 50S ribosomal protein L11 methyltransferase [Pseudomonadota bacterium]|nr:50S ribosomal protein L11 methyltransferase [Pseudomonadota bacterium]
MSISLWHLHLTVPPVAVQPVSDLLEGHVDTLSVFEKTEGQEWTIDAISQGRPDTEVLQAGLARLAETLGISCPRILCEEMPQRDWLAENFASFRPIRAGRYFVHGSHYTDEKPAGALCLQIDAATAFGSGEHGTTWGCLMAMDRLAQDLPQKPRILDMGCGSAILAIAAAKTWNCPVLAVDIDPEAVRVSALNARDNGVADLVQAECGDGYAAPSVHGPYDLVLANILAGPLCAMAPDLAVCLSPGGHTILSGLLTDQEGMVADAHAKQGLKVTDRFPSGEWMTLVLKKVP